MTHWTSLAPTVLASFMASMVEFVEALTIVLAVGVVRGWRSALFGTGAALAVLVALVAALGRSLAQVPLPAVQLVVGTLLLMFGLRWLRKAVLRAAGVVAVHDEVKAFASEAEVLRRAARSRARSIDRVAFGASFKIVILEGIEVVFIVIAIGAGGPLIVPASVGAGLALLAVAGLGLFLHRPLAGVPENSLKFGVGVLLSAFGSFWVGEGIGIAWPGTDLAIPGLIAAFLAVGLLLVPWCAHLRHVRAARPEVSTPSAASVPSPRLLIIDQLWGLFVDDGWLAAGVVFWVTATWFTQTRAAFAGAWLTAAFAAGLNVMLAASAGNGAKA